MREVGGEGGLVEGLDDKMWPAGGGQRWARGGSGGRGIPQGRGWGLRGDREDGNEGGGGGGSGPWKGKGWRCGDMAAAAGRLHTGNLRSRQGEAAVSAAGTAAARGGAAAVAAVEAAVGLLP